MSHELLVSNANAALTKQRNLNLVKPSYGFIDTTDIVDRFERQGWGLSSAKQARVKTIERQGYQRHILKFRHPDFKSIPGLSKDNESIPELLIENSHDGTSALRIFFGVFRIACLNGIIAGTSLAHFRVIHSARSIQKIDEAVAGMTSNIPTLIESVSRFTQIELQRPEQEELARQVSMARLRHTANVVSVDVRSNLTARRPADGAPDLYSVFNVLQERALRGGLGFTQLDQENEPVYKTTRAISSVSQSVKLNRELWDIAESFAV